MDFRNTLKLYHILYTWFQINCIWNQIACDFLPVSPSLHVVYDRRDILEIKHNVTKTECVIQCKSEAYKEYCVAVGFTPGGLVIDNNGFSAYRECFMLSKVRYCINGKSKSINLTIIKMEATEREQYFERSLCGIGVDFLIDFEQQTTNVPQISTTFPLSNLTGLTIAFWYNLKEIPVKKQNTVALFSVTLSPSLEEKICHDLQMFIDTDGDLATRYGNTFSFANHRTQALKWFHVVFVWDNSNPGYSVYINGALSVSKRRSYCGSPGNKTGLTLYLGNDLDPDNDGKCVVDDIEQGFKGSFYDFNVWKGVFAEEDAQKIYHGFNKFPNTLVRWSDFKNTNVNSVVVAEIPDLLKSKSFALDIKKTQLGLGLETYIGHMQDAISVSIWFKISNSTFDDPINNPYLFVVKLNEDCEKIGAFVREAGEVVVLIGDTFIATGFKPELKQWNKMIVTFNTSSFRLHIYINDVIEITETLHQTQFNVPYNTSLLLANTYSTNCKSTQANTTFIGEIADVYMWLDVKLLFIDVRNIFTQNVRRVASDKLAFSWIQFLDKLILVDGLEKRFFNPY